MENEPTSGALVGKTEGYGSAIGFLIIIYTINT